MRKKRILLVDDEAGFTRLLKLNLEQLRSYEVRVENGATEVLTAAREFRPDLVLLDLIMPQMIGQEVAELLRRDVDLTKTPIVFLSAAVSGNAADGNCLAAGYPFIAKPATVEEVIESIERHLSPTTTAELRSLPPRLSSHEQ